MDIARTLSVAINANGATTGAATAAAAFNRVGNAAKEMDVQTWRARQGIASVSSAIGFLKSAVAGLGLGLMVRELYQTDNAMIRLRNQLRAASGDAEQFRRNFEFIRGVSNKLGLDLRATGDAFGQFVASAKGKLSGAQIRETFTSISEAAVTMGLSTEQTSGSIVALTQMLSKGTVSAQELRQQLGNALPGAFQMAAQAMGKTEKEMNKLLDSGSIMSDELVPALAKKLHEAFGPGSIEGAKTLQAEMNRLKTTWTELQMIFMSEGGESIFGRFLKSARSALQTIKGWLVSLFQANNEGQLSEALAASLRIGIGKAANYFGGFVKTAAEMMSEVGKRVFTPEYLTALVGAFQSVAAAFGLALLEALRKPLAALKAGADWLTGETASSQKRFDILSGEAGLKIRSDIMDTPLKAKLTPAQYSLYQTGDFHNGAIGQMFNSPDQDIVRREVAALESLVEAEKQRQVSTLPTNDKKLSFDELYRGELAKPQTLFGDTIDDLKKQNQASMNYFLGQFAKLTADATFAAGSKLKDFKPLNSVDTSADESLLKGFGSRSSNFWAITQSGEASENTPIKPKRLLDEFKEGIKEASAAFGDEFARMKQVGAETVGAMSSGFTNFFDSIIDGTDGVAKSFTKMTASILRDIAKIIAQRMVAEPLAGAVTSGIGSLLGNLFPGTAAGSSSLTLLGGYQSSFGTSVGAVSAPGTFGSFHTGGFVGLTLGSHKIVDPSIFSRAPRLHSGLKPDEFPAILQRGEEVVPRSEVGRRAPVSVSVTNNVTVDGSKGGTPEQNQRFGAEVARQLEAMVESVLIKNLGPRGILNPQQ